MVRPRIVTAALAAATILFALPACQDEEPVVAEGATVELELDEYTIEPQEVIVDFPVITLVAHNVGRLSHNVRIVKGTKELGGVDTMQPGRTEKGTVILDPGSYRMECTLSNHDNLGQYGTLIVK